MHTPGPWIAEEKGAEAMGGYSILTSRGWDDDAPWIADVNGTHVGPKDLAEIAANASLIAAAPELLDALKAAVEFMEEDLESLVDSNTVPTEDGPDMTTLSDEARPYFDDLTKELATARAAIAKATGGAA